MPNDFDTEEIARELAKIRDRQKERAERVRSVMFWAMWIVPVIVMQLTIPNATILDGSIAVVPAWFIGFPLAYLLCRRFLKDKP
jgi:hypothetical protein